MRNTTLKQILMGIGGLVLLCTTGPLSFDIFGVIPVTLQSLWVILLASVSGWFGVIAVGAYVFMGLAGLPVFSNYGSGWIKIHGPSGGFLVGFILIAIGLVLYLKQNPVQSRPVRCFFLFVVAHIILLILGFSWMLVVLEGASSIIGSLLLLLSPGLILKSIVGTALSKIIYDRMLIEGSEP